MLSQNLFNFMINSWQNVNCHLWHIRNEIEWLEPKLDRSACGIHKQSIPLSLNTQARQPSLVPAIKTLYGGDSYTWPVFTQACRMTLPSQGNMLWGGWLKGPLFHVPVTTCCVDACTCGSCTVIQLWCHCRDTMYTCTHVLWYCSCVQMFKVVGHKSLSCASLSPKFSEGGWVECRV